MGLTAGLAEGWQAATGVLNLGLVIVGVLLGVLLGATSRLRAIHGVAILLPLTYALSIPVDGTLVLLVSLYFAAEFARKGSVDEPAARGGSAWHLRQKLAWSGSFLGGMVGVVGLILALLLLQRPAMSLGPAEYAVLVIFAFASLAIRAGTNPLRTLVSTLLGLMLATIGIDSATGQLRFTFDQPQLYDGIEFTTVVVGLFGIGQLFNLLAPPAQASVTNFAQLPDVRKSMWVWRWTVLRSAFVGFVVGVLPGAGTSVAGTTGIRVERAAIDSGEEFSPLRETLAKETANSAAVGGAMVPLLALGIPGSGTTAILLGALLLHNLTPGPAMFSRQAPLIWTLALAMALANLLLAILYWPLDRLLRRAQHPPEWVFAPAMIVLAFIGVFSVNQSAFSLLIMLLIGLAAHLLERRHYPLVPLLLGFVLGELFEDNLRRALAISGEDFQVFFASPTSRLLWLATLLVLILPWLLRRIGARRGGDQVRQEEP